MRALLIPDSALPTFMTIEHPEDPEEFQAAADGYIEEIVLPGLGSIIVNEDGKAKKLRVNNLATTIAAMRGRLRVGDRIVGPAVLVGPSPDGRPTDVTDEAIEFVMRAIAVCVAWPREAN